MKKGKLFYQYFCLVISLILVGTTIYRAATTGITYDESYTYLYYVPTNPLKVFLEIFNEGVLANNHILNSFFISMFNALSKVKYNEFIIRFPNILFYIVYLYFAYKICENNKYRYAGFSLLTLNYGLNEFFGLGRGYGMSSALVLGGLYYFKEYLSNNKKSTLNISYIFLLASCYANSSSLIVYATILLLSGIYLLKNKKLIDFLKKNFLLIPIIAGTVIIILYHFHVSKSNLPLYGGTTGFYNDVLRSMFSVYGFADLLINYLLNILILLLVIIFARKYNKNDNNYIRLSAVVYCLLLIIVTKASGKMWMTGRSLLPTIPLMSISIIEIVELLKIKKTIIFQSIIVILLVLTFANNYSVNYTREWKDNYSLREKCYEAFNNKDNTETIKDRDHLATRFYREKILFENGYDIFNENSNVEVINEKE